MRLAASPLSSLRMATVLVAGVAAGVYANSLENDFAYDDVHIILENPGIHTVEALPGALTEPYWPGGHGRQLGLWRPATTLLLGLQYAVAGDSAVVYHVTNVVTHALVSGLVVVLLAQLMTLGAAFAAGLIFAVHPVHVEAVANIIGIAEIAPALFFLLACVLHLRGPPATSWSRALGIGVLYALAFGAKESAVTLPGVIFLLDAARRDVGFRELAAYLRDRWRLYLVMVVVAGLLLGGRFAVLGSIANPLGPLGADLLREIPRIWTLGEVWSHYVRLLVFPLDLSADYSPNVVGVHLGWNPANLTGVVLALALLVGALAAWRRPTMEAGRSTARAVAFGVMWFVITISPVSNVVFLSGVLLAERTLYLPSVGFAAAAGWLVARVAGERPVRAWVSTAVVVVLMGWRSWDRNPTWRDNVSVFGTLIEEYPQSGRSQWILGDLYFQQGRLSEGLVSYRLAINILGPHYQLITEISRKLIGAEYFDAAEHLLHFAWEEYPQFSVAPGLLAVIHSERGDPLETERFCRIALALEDRDPVSHHLLAWALTEQERWDEAVEARRGAIEHGEGDYWQQWLSLAWLEAFAGDTVAARAAMDSALSKARTPGTLRRLDSLRAEILGDTTRIGEEPADSGRDGDP
jgi:tetratricopeptide (TPR) repeat protein